MFAIVSAIVHASLTTIRRFFLAIFIAITAMFFATYYALNSPYTQTHISTYLNTHVFKKLEVQASLKGVSVSLWPIGLKLDSVVLERTQSTQFCGGMPCRAKIVVGRIVVEIAPLESYQRRDLVFSGVAIGDTSVSLDYTDNGELFLPIRMPDVKLEAPEQINPLKMLSTVQTLIPQNVQVEKFRLSVGNPSKNSKRAAYSGTLKKGTWQYNNQQAYSRLKLNFENNSIHMPLSDPKKSPVQTTMERVEIDAKIHSNGSIELGTFKCSAPNLNITASGKIRVTEHPSVFPASIKVNAELPLKETLSWVDFDGGGTLSFRGNVIVANKTGELSVDGQAKWSHDARIDTYALHGGKADVAFSNRKLQATNLVIEPKQGGKIMGSGEVAFLANEVSSTIKAQVEDLPFGTLMQGLDVPTNAVEFLISSSNLGVDFTIGDGGKEFDLSVIGPVQTKNLVVPALHSPTRTPIQSCQGHLDLYTNLDHLDLQGTQLNCNKESGNGGSVSLTKGTVDYRTGATMFRLVGSDVEFVNAEYFLMDNPEFFKQSRTTGLVSIDGTISAKNSQSPVVFSAKLNGKNIRLYGAEFHTLQGDILIDDSKVEGFNLLGFVDNISKSHVDLKHFFVKFDTETNALFDGTAQGNVRSFVQATQSLHQIPQEEINSIEGQLLKSPISIALPFSPKPKTLPAVPKGIAPFQQTLYAFLNWNINASVSAQNLRVAGGTYKQIRADIHCNNSICRDSKIRVNGPYSSSDKKNRSPSQILLDVNTLSPNEVNVVSKIAGVPLEAITAGAAGGTVSGSINILGPWKTWETNSKLSIDNLQFNGRNLGFVQAGVATSSYNNLEIRVEGLSSGLSARFSAPRSLSGGAQAFVTLRDISLERLFQNSQTPDIPFQSLLDAEVILEGPAPFTPSLQNVPWYESWQIKGMIQKLLAQSKDFKFGLQNQAPFSYRNGIWKVDPFLIANRPDEKNPQVARMEGEAIFNSNTKELNAHASLNLDLGTLQKVLPQFGAGNGMLQASLQLTGNVPDIRWKGQGSVKQGGLLIQAFPPSLRNLETQFVFNDKRLEVENLSANKGEGRFEVSGAVDWSKMITENDSLPSFRIVGSFENAQTRIPIPVVQSLDTEVSGEIVLCRKRSCAEFDKTRTANDKQENIFVGGDITLREARITRGLDCMDIVRAIPKPNDALNTSQNSSVADIIQLGLKISAPGSLVVDTRCARANLTANEIQIDGIASNPQINGRITTNNSTGTGQFGNIKFNIENATLEFDGAANNPRYNILLSTQVAGYRADKQRIDYKVFIQLDDRPQNKERAQPEIRSEPPVHPDGQRPLSQTDLVAMVITGRGPDASAPSSLSTEIVANEFATLGTNAIFSETRLENSVSRMLNRLSAGIVDRVAIEPLFEAGRPKFRIRTIVEPVERVNVNVETDQDPAGTSASAKNASLTAQWLLNNRINLGLDLRFQGEKLDAPLSMGGGILFRFGGD